VVCGDLKANLLVALRHDRVVEAGSEDALSAQVRNQRRAHILDRSIMPSKRIGLVCPLPAGSTPTAAVPGKDGTDGGKGKAAAVDPPAALLSLAAQR
jgi:hypothetical protein